jgi:triphosphatase
MARTVSSESKQPATTRSPGSRVRTSTMTLSAKRFRAGSPSVRKAAKAPKSPTWSKSAPVILNANATVDSAIFVIISACRDHWQKNMAAAVTAELPEGLHQVRVGLRRLRSALTAFKKYIPEAQRTWLNTEAKWLLTQLGPARDLDVFIQDLAEPFAERVSEDAELAQLMRVARAAQASAHQAAARTLKGTRALRFAGRLETWLTGHGWRTGGEDKKHNSRAISAVDFSRRFLNRRLHNLRTDYNDVKTLTVEERHEMRIAVKKIRYGVEFFQALLPAKRAQRLNGILKDLQDNLGHLNDIDVAKRTVDALVNDATSGIERRQIASGGSAISEWHEDAAAKAAPKTIKLWRKLKKVPAF